MLRWNLAPGSSLTLANDNKIKAHGEDEGTDIGQKGKLGKNMGNMFVAVGVKALCYDTDQYLNSGCLRRSHKCWGLGR